MADTTNYIIDSDYPMPAQKEVVTATVNIPSGTASGVWTETTVNVQGASIFRVSFRSSRAGKVFVGSNFLNYAAGDNQYSCSIGVSSSGQATIRVGNSGSSATTAAETITVSLSCFIMP